MAKYRITIYNHTCTMTFRGKVLNRYQFKMDSNSIEDVLFKLLDDKLINFNIRNGVKIEISELNEDSKKDAVKKDKEYGYLYRPV